MMKNDYKIGTLDSLVTYYDRDKNHGTINGIETVTAETMMRCAIKMGERWKAVSNYGGNKNDSKEDISKYIVLEARYTSEINTENTIIKYQGISYKVRDIEIMGRRQYMKITAQRDQA